MDLAFDQRGNLVPYDKVKLTFEEFKSFFVDNFSGSKHRHHIFEGYQNFIEDFSQEVSGNITQWIDGSFVTSKEHPNDIDFVTFIDHEVFEAKESLIHKHFRLDGAKKKYGVDAYTVRRYPESHSKYMLYQADWVYWYDWFSQTKKNRAKKKFPKGFIEVEFKSSANGSKG